MASDQDVLTQWKEIKSTKVEATKIIKSFEAIMFLLASQTKIYNTLTLEIKNKSIEKDKLTMRMNEIRSHLGLKDYLEKRDEKMATNPISMDHLQSQVEDRVKINRT